MTSAIVCGDSLRRKTTICSAGVRRRNSNGRRSIVAARRPMISSARVAPSERSSTLRAKSTPPSAMYSSAITVSTASATTSLQTSAGTLRALAISSESDSSSDSPRWRTISEARCSPIATSRAAAFWTPRMLAVECLGEAAGASAVTLLLGHPLLDLRGDALRLALHQLVELAQRRVGHPRRERDRGGVAVVRERAALELGERHGLLDLGQPAR